MTPAEKNSSLELFLRSDESAKLKSRLADREGIAFDLKMDLFAHEGKVVSVHLSV